MTALLCGVMAHQTSGAATPAVERIPFALPSLKASKMPPVFFAHEKHITAVEAKGDDCGKCHNDDPEYFLDSKKQPASKVVAYVHKECVACHALSKYGKETGPQLASCRACHSDEIAQKHAQKSAKK